jgi:GT2 family glycosyltransferase
MPRLSIVIPTYNRLPRLKHVLVALEQQTYSLDDAEVIVVSDGSTDGTHEYLSALHSPLNLRFVAQANSGPAAARNTGINTAQGKYILFIDDDVVPAPQMVGEHMKLHTDDKNLVVLGPMLNPPDFKFSPWVSWEQAMLVKQYQAMLDGQWKATARQFYTGNTSLRRQILIDAGGFDERFRRAEDIELAYRLDKQQVEFMFTMDAIGYHYAERSYQSWLQTPYTYGRYDIVFSREQRQELLEFVREEFTYRNRLIRAFVLLCLDRPLLSRSMITTAKFIANLTYKAGIEGLSRAGYSAIFNLRYYQGVADELGGRKRFFKNQSGTSKHPATS